MKRIHIDEKWSVEYDEADNCRPKRWFRYDEEIGVEAPSNLQLALFYALLESKGN